MEVLLSLSIFIILFSVQVPTFISFWQYRILEIQTNQILQDIELVRNLALEKRESLIIKFYGSANYYEFETDQAGSSKPGRFIKRNFNRFCGFPFYFGVTPVSYTDESGGLVQGAINFGGMVQDSYGSLTFNSSGNPSSGGHIVMYAKRINKGLVVIVKPVTGRVRIGRVFLHFSDNE